MNREVLFSSIRLDWKTPSGLYQKLNKEFQFDFDPCPPKASFDGLSIPWGKRNFINPPYGRDVFKWVEKAFRESCEGKLCVMLLASRTDTRWFHKLALEYATEIRFIKGRLKFDDQENPAPFPSVIVIFDGSWRR